MSGPALRRGEQSNGKKIHQNNKGSKKSLLDKCGMSASKLALFYWKNGGGSRGMDCTERKRVKEREQEARETDGNE